MRHPLRCEVNGDTTPTVNDNVLTATDLALQPQPQSASLDSVTAKRPRGRPFVAGDPRSNTRGRPRKGESFAEKYRKAVERDADAIIRAHVDAAKGAGIVGSRERALTMAYAMGRPVQPYVNVGGDDPLTALSSELAQHSQLPESTQTTDDNT